MHRIQLLALKRKYLQYVVDPLYRRAYRERIYYNVNMEVPPGALVDKQDNVFIMERKTADDLNNTVLETPLKHVSTVYTDHRQDDAKCEMDAFIMHEHDLEKSLNYNSFGPPLANSSFKEPEKEDDDPDKSNDNASLGSPMANSTFIGEPGQLKDDPNELPQPKTPEPLHDAVSSKAVVLAKPSALVKPSITNPSAGRSTITSRKVTVRRFADPDNPRATILVEKEVARQMATQGADNETKATAQVTIRRTDEDGNVTKKRFFVNQALKKQTINQTPTAELSSSGIVQLPDDTVKDALAILDNNSNAMDAGPPKPIELPNFFHSPGIVEWFVRNRRRKVAV